MPNFAIVLLLIHMQSYVPYNSNEGNLHCHIIPYNKSNIMQHYILAHEMQVHRAVMKDGFQVAMKIQYPGVADSIESDIENVKLLLNYTNLIPEGLYLDRAIKVLVFQYKSFCLFQYPHLKDFKPAKFLFLLPPFASFHRVVFLQSYKFDPKAIFHVSLF